ncbi:YkgJ family cysteine cluster protein [Desulfobacterales bacterium HSG16]|nr:YkgJ family cysteine cluster protein [Desulfobacterales bacterium HSG16]
MNDRTISQCRRCGTCCKKGGPALHVEDHFLVRDGKILAKDLFTIRKGEPSFDNIKRCLAPATTDIIKIRGVGEKWTCVFFEENTNGCMIYSNRPVECRALKCWDTSKIEMIYQADRLTRKDLFSDIRELYDLIREHQNVCSYEKLEIATGKLDGKERENALYEIEKIIRFDHHLRSFAVEKGKIDHLMIDFLFGRSLLKTVAAFGISAEMKENRLIIKPKSSGIFYESG